MEHSHHHHSSASDRLGKAFVVGIFLNAAFVVVEFVAGIYTQSLALLSDAGHNLSDVAMLALALLAFKISKKKSSTRYTYGFSKTTVLVSFINALVLLVAVGAIGWEAIGRFSNPQNTKGDVVSWVAAVGIVINAVSALFFLRDKDKDLNVKGAYLHLLVDALVSLGVVIAGLLIYYTHIMWIDPLVSLLIMFVIIYSTRDLFFESLRLLIDGVPHTIDTKKIEEEALLIAGVQNIHHIHIWAMSTTQNALTAHLLLQPNLSESEIMDIKKQLKHKLEHLNIQHATIETETAWCKDVHCKEFGSL
ncbi:MAG: cation transporter [Bacteroidetes bacterium]|nr:cation transporter [Bacteroidota bacterium]